MTPVAAPADKRFRRSRVSPARKRRWWQPPWWTIARVGTTCLVAGFALYFTIGFVLASDALTVTRITVQGNQRMSRGEVLGLLDGLSGTSIVMTDLESWRQKLLMSPWVEEASIRRMFPGTLAVAIEERQPIGIGRIKGTLCLIDKTGTVIDEFGPNYADLDLPIVDGLSPKGEEDQSMDQARAALAGRLMSELARRPKLAGQVSQIDVTDSRNAIVYVFRAVDYGVALPETTDWHQFEHEGWAAAIRRQGPVCTMVAFRGTRGEMKSFLSALTTK